MARGNPLRILVCGSNYGRTYLDAITAQPAEYELAGLLAKGSERSVAVAERHGARLFRSVAELPAGIELQRREARRALASERSTPATRAAAA